MSASLLLVSLIVVRGCEGVTDAWSVLSSFTAKYVRGVYAVRVKGRIPEDVEAELADRGIKYRPRDQTDMD